ncbi:endonuclease/exonuclease/phosphatase family protein [Actinokineospora iranica]|uniref:Metal-dependent hydrolase, endonuclease/exonuclease/phosphatase family n=1 Tax=Actinokineospora iranica TaxID=1271860 RepID=A0A1G6LKQ2_9PSEU|nr:endonuclease/exonuclease/phosphatase family protein [Actinokineospora iranica]SDC43759.1 Metal-dependent hydrolase, endonuclease/exonuclease/phosphatase family [Actinokineospora iranica]
MREILLALLLLLPAPPQPPPVPVRVATVNMHSGVGADGALDLARTAAAIRDTGAGIVGLQEVDVHWSARSAFADQARELARLTGMRVFFAPIYDLPGAPRRRFGVAVLSAYPMPRTENHEITRLSTQDPNAVPAPAPGFAEAEILVRGRRVHVYVTHLDYRPDPAVRAAQVADTRRVLAADEPGAAQILLGDLNAEQDAPELAPLWTTLTRADTGPTFPGPDFPHSAKTLDHIAVSDAIHIRAATTRPGAASDHWPVVADLLVPQG